VSCLYTEICFLGDLPPFISLYSFILLLWFKKKRKNDFMCLLYIWILIYLASETTIPSICVFMRAAFRIWNQMTYLHKTCLEHYDTEGHARAILWFLADSNNSLAKGKWTKFWGDRRTNATCFEGLKWYTITEGRKTDVAWR